MPGNNRILALSAIAAGASAAFAVLTILERDHRLAEPDRKALKKVGADEEKPRRMAERLHPLGKWWSYTPAAIAAGATAYAKGSGRRSQRAAGASAVVLAAVASALVNPLFDRILPQPPLPPRRRSDPKPTFPSGHTFGLGAVAMSMAYVLHREGIVGAAAAAPIALLPPLIGGAAKVIEKKHWPSEVAGGLLVAIGIASLSALLYEGVRVRSIEEA